MIRCKVYRQGREVVVAACDQDLVGQELRDGKLRLKVTEAFYGTDSVSSQDLVQQLRVCTIANLVGHRVVALAMEQGLIAESNVLWIGGVPHAQLATL
ncbi:MAG: DUF424 family protein [Halobacteriales archaeon]|nr:DUF424 family protein [Halobacteriales archaeon]